ncbi:hypothetical protein BCR33DRAFT_770880 [Rhizoclosmatium globosum]|uniref:Uncharacterized protein n=1 Tax=Rhizoclosmatium globosum TaxID=329046 RepID=A0A1Y2BHZ1_9FUNG|nr:hypothetical protein BCR33DRAFT_770880 [Rhizoclosmatium globosum]|eukprot:ORY34411.1 hypothetical protein BCR33DRAFT_770880 [Rhizoclosmatium globosum]
MDRRHKAERVRVEVGLLGSDFDEDMEEKSSQKEDGLNSWHRMTKITTEEGWFGYNVCFCTTVILILRLNSSFVIPDFIPRLGQQSNNIDPAAAHLAVILPAIQLHEDIRRDLENEERVTRINEEIEEFRQSQEVQEPVEYPRSI